MKRFAKFVFVGLVVALSLEFLFCLVASHRPRAFGVALFFYPAYFVFVYLSSKLFPRLTKNRVVSDMAYYLIYGGIGLAIEWSLLGNAPWSNPKPIQTFMFAFWVAFAMIPRIFTDDRLSDQLTKWKRYFSWYYVLYVVIALMGAVLPDPARKLYVIFLSGAAFLVMHVFYVWYFAKAWKVRSLFPHPSAERSFQ